jgi:transposase
VRTDVEWRMLPHDFPRWDAVSQQTRRGLAAGVVAATIHNLRTLLRLELGRAGQPSAAILASTTLPSTPESGTRAGYDGHQRRKVSKLHAAVDTPAHWGHLLALPVTPADAQDRAQIALLAVAVQEATGETVQLASFDEDSPPQAMGL